MLRVHVDVGAHHQKVPTSSEQPAAAEGWGLAPSSGGAAELLQIPGVSCVPPPEDALPLTARLCSVGGLCHCELMVS